MDRVIPISTSWVLLEVFLNGYEAAYFMSFPTIKVGVKPWVKRAHIVIYWAALTVAFCIINFTTAFDLVSMYLFPLLVLTYITFFIKDSILLRLCWYAFPLNLLHSIDIATLSVLVYIKQVPAELIAQHGTNRLIWIILAKSLHTILWIFLLKQRNTNVKATYRYLTTLIISCLATQTLNLYLLAFGGIDKLVANTLFNFLPIAFCCTIFCLLVFFMVIQKLNQEDKKNIVNQLSSNYNIEILNADKSVRKFRSDVMHQMKEVWPVLSNMNYEGSIFTISIEYPLTNVSKNIILPGINDIIERYKGDYWESQEDLYNTTVISMPYSTLIFQ